MMDPPIPRDCLGIAAELVVANHVVCIRSNKQIKLNASSPWLVNLEEKKLSLRSAIFLHPIVLVSNYS